MKGVVMKNRNWFFGVFFLISAIFVITSQIGSFGKIGVMSILVTLFLAVLVFHGLISRNFFEIFIPLSILYMIYYKPFALIYISPWLLILSAVLVSIGFSLLFERRPKKITFSQDGTKYLNQVNENSNNNNPYAKVTISSSSIYLHSESLQGGHFISNLGELEVYFDQVQLSTVDVEIFLECNLGTIKLYIPRHWNVDDNMHSILGEVKYYPQHTEPSQNAPQLKLAGNVVMGNVEIQYI
jgi:predicted membrane protein